MPLEKIVFTVVLGFFAIWLLEFTLRKRWDLPKEKERIYYSKMHRILFHTLMAISFLATMTVSFLMSTGTVSYVALALPAISSGTTELLKAFMQWKHAENRYLYKATLLSSIGTVIIFVLMVTSIFEGMDATI